jgi:hypothetical protein
VHAHMCRWFLTATEVYVQARGAFLDFIETALADTAIPITELKYRCAAGEPVSSAARGAAGHAHSQFACIP